MLYNYADGIYPRRIIWRISWTQTRTRILVSVPCFWNSLIRLNRTQKRVRLGLFCLFSYAEDVGKIKNTPKIGRKKNEVIQKSKMTAYIIIIVICLIGSAYFSATETAFSTLNRIRVKNLAEKGSNRAKLTLKLAEDYDSLLSAILI